MASIPHAALGERGRDCRHPEFPVSRSALTGAKLAPRIDTERTMATKQSGAGRIKSSAKKRVRDAKTELKSLRKLAKVAKKAAKVALKKAKVKTQAARPAAPARAVP